MLAALMWSLFAIAVLAVVTFFAALALHVLLALTKTQAPPLHLVPLFGCALVSAFVGGFCGLALAAMSAEGSPARVTLIVVTIILLGGAVLTTASILHQFWLNSRKR